MFSPLFMFGLNADALCLFWHWILSTMILSFQTSKAVLYTTEGIWSTSIRGQNVYYYFTTLRKLEVFKSRQKYIHLLLTGKLFLRFHLQNFQSLVFISLCHDNVSCTISRNFWKKRKKPLPINLLQQKHSLAEPWDGFQVLIRFTEPRTWGSLQKPCYCERWLHRKPPFFPADRELQELGSRSSGR